MILKCNFQGGRYHGQWMSMADAILCCDGRSRDWTFERDRGCLVPRAELDNQPKFQGYLGPMWDGLRYDVDGQTYYEFELRHRPAVAAKIEAEHIEPYGVLRYETQEVYDLLSR